MAAPTPTVEAESRATMTLNMSRAEMDVVEHLAASHDLSKTRVMRQALKVYQLIQARLKPGQQLRFGDEPSKSILFVGPGFEPVDSCTYDGKECYVARGTDDAHYRCGTSACPHPNTTRATPSQTTGEVETVQEPTFPRLDQRGLLVWLRATAEDHLKRSDDVTKAQTLRDQALDWAGALFDVASEIESGRFLDQGPENPAALASPPPAGAAR